MLELISWNLNGVLKLQVEEMLSRQAEEAGDEFQKGELSLSSKTQEETLAGSEVVSEEESEDSPSESRPTVHSSGHDATEL